MSIRRVSSVIIASSVALSVLSACGGSDNKSASAGTNSTETTVTNEPVAVYPLTGLPVTDPSVLGNTAIVAKIDNHPSARPQTGLSKADIIFEENVEKLTRFAVVFHSQGSDPVGPLRSGRTQDIDLLGSLNQPLFVWSGGNSRVTKFINNSDLVNLGPTPSRGKGGYYREKTRKAPHNLYTKTSTILSIAPQPMTPPQPQFTYRGVSDAVPATAIAIDGAKVKMDNVPIYWQWDAASGNFLRSSLNTRYKLEPHMDSDGTQVNAKNVIVIYVSYKRSKGDHKSPEAQTVGKGEVYVMTNGTYIQGTWERKDRLTPFTFKDASGSVIKLTPGRTFVELSRVTAFSPVLPGIDPGKVKWSGV